jgi:dihydropteroate synthase
LLVSGILDCGARRFPLERPLVMGIVNVTADSFSDGGQFLDVARAAAHGERLAAEGADLVDVPFRSRKSSRA